MSETETHKGKLSPVIIVNPDGEERAEEICKLVGIERTEAFNTWQEALDEFGYGRIVEFNKQVYLVKDIELNPYGFVESEKTDTGEIDYFISYYNGGASLTEVLELVIKEAK